MTEQPALFASPSEEYADLVEEWWYAHLWTGRYRCPLCGRLERSRSMFIMNHDQPPGSLWLARRWAADRRIGRFCTMRHLSIRQAVWGLRQDDPWLWRSASMDLRKMAAARQGARM